MTHMIYFILIIFIPIKFSSSEIITLRGPNDTTYTYDNRSILGQGATAKVYKGLEYFHDNGYTHIHIDILIRFNTYIRRIGTNQNDEMVAIKISRQIERNKNIENELYAYDILNETGE